MTRMKLITTFVIIKLFGIEVCTNTKEIIIKMEYATFFFICFILFYFVLFFNFFDFLSNRYNLPMQYNLQLLDQLQLHYDTELRQLL